VPALRRENHGHEIAALTNELTAAKARIQEMARDI
jgi:hypothetical protein